MSLLSCCSDAASFRLRLQLVPTLFHSPRHGPSWREPLCSFVIRRSPLHNANPALLAITVLILMEDKACARISARVSASGDSHALAGGKALRVPPCTPLRAGGFRAPFAIPSTRLRFALVVLHGTPRRGVHRRRQGPWPWSRRQGDAHPPDQPRGNRPPVACRQHVAALNPRLTE
jgi:hypothetical protein